MKKALFVLTLAGIASATYFAQRGDVFGTFAAGAVTALAAFGFGNEEARQRLQRKLDSIQEDYLRREFERESNYGGDTDVTVYRVAKRYEGRESDRVWEESASRLDIGKYRKHLN